MNLDVGALTEMGVTLTTLAVKGTATAIYSKIESVKSVKDADKLRNTYDEIISELLSEREEAIRVAMAYKEELEKVQISDEDIEHLHNTVEKIIEIFKEKTPESESIDSFEQLKELISVDTLKTMQLLGFNYKAAIGEPLTELCANAISGIGKKSNFSGRKK